MPTILRGALCVALAACEVGTGVGDADVKLEPAQMHQVGLPDGATGLMLDAAGSKALVSGTQPVVVELFSLNVTALTPPDGWTFTSTTMSPDGSRVVGGVMKQDGNTLRRKIVVLGAGDEPVLLGADFPAEGADDSGGLVLSQDGRQVFLASQGRILVMDAATGAAGASYRLESPDPEERTYVLRAVASQGDRVLVEACRAGSQSKQDCPRAVWRAETEAQVVWLYDARCVSGLAFTAGGSALSGVLCKTPVEARQWSTGDGDVGLVWNLLKRSTDPATQWAFSTAFAVEFTSTAMHVHSMTTGKYRQSWALTGPISQLAITADGNRIVAVGGTAGALRLYWWPLEFGAGPPVFGAD